MPYLGNNLGVAFSSYKLIDSLTASFNGTTTSFALTVNGVTPVPFPLNEQNILLSVGGVPQKPDSTGTEGFRFSGSNIVFSSAPKTGEAFWGVILAGADRVNAGVQYPDGTAAVPSISFASQTTTGFYRSGSGQIGVGINGSTPVAFSTSGVQLNGSTSGSVIIASPAVAGNNTLTLPTGNGTAGQVLTTNGSGALSWTGMGPAFSATANATQSISSGATAKLAFQAEQFDTASAYDNATNYRFLPSVAGYYLITAGYNCTLGGYTNAFANIMIYKNGAGYRSNSTQPTNGNYSGAAINEIVYFNGSTDYAEIFAVANQALTIVFNSFYSAYFSGCLLRPA